MNTNGTAGLNNEWFMVDLGLNTTLLANKFSYRYRDESTSYCPTAWKWEASNDNVTWDELANETGRGPNFSNWVTSNAAVQTTYYRYFRIRQIGVNTTGQNHFSAGEIELYGTLRY